jgi:hypothetical protein
MRRSALQAGNAHEDIVGLFGFAVVPSEPLHSEAHSDLKRKWPRHVALPAEKVRGLMSAHVLPAPRRQQLRRVLLAKSEDAAAFAKRFGGDRLAVSER